MKRIVILIAMLVILAAVVQAANFNKRLHFKSQDFTSVKVRWVQDYVTVLDSVTLSIPKDTILTLDDAYNWQIEYVWMNVAGDTIEGSGSVITRNGVSLTGTQTFNTTGNITGNLSGSVGSVTGNVGGNVTGSVGSVTGAVGSVTGAVGSVTGNVSGNILGTLAGLAAGQYKKIADSAAYEVAEEDTVGHQPELADVTKMEYHRSKTSASSMTEATIADAVWDELHSGHLLAGSFGLYLDAAVSGVGGGSSWTTAMTDSIMAGLWRASGSGANIWGNNIGINWADVTNPTTSVSLSNTIINDVTGSVDISATSIDLMWDEVQSGHITAGTFGAYLDALVSSRLAPTTSGRTLDVTTTGEAGVDLSNVNGTLDAAEIGTDAITNTKIAADAIGASEIAASAVTPSEAPNLDAAVSTRSTFNAATDSTITDGSALLALKLDDGASGTDSTLLQWLRAGAAAGAGGGATADQIWDEVQAGHVIVGTFGYYLNAQISGISGGAGTGAYSYTVRLVDTSATPDAVVDGVHLRVANVTQTGFVRDVKTDVFGNATYNLDAGQWVVFTTDSRFAFNLDTFTVSAIGTYVFNNAAAVLIDADTLTTTVAFVMQRPDGTANDSAIVNIELKAKHPDSLLRVNDNIVAATYRQFLLRADSNGRVLVNLYGNSLFTNDSTYYRATVKNRFNDQIIQDFKFRVPIVGSPAADTVHYINNLPRWK